MCGADEATLVPCSMIVVAYGKFGGIELGYGSDLDLVFLHDSRGEVQRTTGPVVVENSVFFLRLVQRLVHLLTVHSSAGRLYEVDTRLRPSGKGGLLVQSIEGFRRLPAYAKRGPGNTSRCCGRERWPARPSSARDSRRCAATC